MFGTVLNCLYLLKLFIRTLENFIISILVLILHPVEVRNVQSE